jgi:hypothetical protein
MCTTCSAFASVSAGVWVDCRARLPATRFNIRFAQRLLLLHLARAKLGKPQTVDGRQHSVDTRQQLITCAPLLLNGRHRTIT